MKLFTYIFPLLVVIILSVNNNKQKTDANLCEVINSTRQLSKFNFEPAELDKVSVKGLIKLDKTTHLLLFDEEQNDIEKNYLYGKFKISKNRSGLVCFSKTVECDQDFYFFSLHIIDNCRQTNDYITLTSGDVGSEILYNISSSLNKTFDILIVKREQTSEWATDPNSKTDTLFTDIIKIDLKSKNLDTLERQSFYEIINNE